MSMNESWVRNILFGHAVYSAQGVNIRNRTSVNNAIKRKATHDLFALCLLPKDTKYAEHEIFIGFQSMETSDFSQRGNRLDKIHCIYEHGFLINRISFIVVLRTLSIKLLGPAETYSALDAVAMPLLMRQ